MVRKKKKAWGPSNPLYRYLQAKKGTKTKRRAKRTGVIMARRKRVSHRASGLGGGKLMRGLFPQRGIVGQVLIGAGIATLQEKVLPQVVPYQSEIIAGVVAGIPGSAGSYGRNMLKGGLFGSQVSTANPYGNY